MSFWVALPAVLLGATGAYFMGIHWLGQFTEQIHLKVYWFVLIALAIMAVIVISCDDKILAHSQRESCKEYKE